MNLRYIFLLPVLLVALLSNAQNYRNDITGIEPDAPVLSGFAQQGGFLFAKTSDTVLFDNNVISNGSSFTLGISRDSKDTIQLNFVNYISGVKTYSYVIEKKEWRIQHINVEEKYVEAPPELKERTAREAKDVRNARSKSIDAEEYFNIKSPLDLKKYRLSGVFGSQRIYNGKPKSYHSGIDYAAPLGTPVKSAANGVVVLVQDLYFAGNTVIVSHGQGVFTSYLHLSEFKVNVGDSVTHETTLGLVGSTGRSTGAHLHFSIYWNNTSLNPELFLR